MLCATIKTDSLQAIFEANDHADLIELRLDLFSPKDLGMLRANCKKPVIFVMKSFDYEKLKVYPEYVDLPSDAPVEEFEKSHQFFPKVKRICSYHNFEKTDDLDAVYTQIQSRPAELYKIACMARSTIDSLKMLCFVRKMGCIGVSMGEGGMITRILAPVFGSPWTYAPITEEQKTAPGQLLLSELTDVYRIRCLSKSSSIYGLIGDPVNKSRSHRLHNFAFNKLGLDAVYIKMVVKVDELEDFFSLSKELGFKGLSVAMPLKEAIVKYLDSALSNAVNTVCFNEKSYGWNTDGPGALDALEKKMHVKGKKIVLLGAGGAAIGIAGEAVKRGAKLTILNRTLSRAEGLAKNVGGAAAPLADFPLIAKAGYDIVINCTCVGMGEDQNLPVLADSLLENKVVMDIISNPRETPLLKAAQLKGCVTVDGMDMWTQQAIGQYSYWFKEHFKT